MVRHRALYLQTDADRLRNSGEREMVSGEYFVPMETQLEQLCRKQQCSGITCCVKRKNSSGGKTKKEVLEATKKNFMEKPLHFQFMRKTYGI